MHLNLKAIAKIALTSVCLFGASAAFAGGPEMHVAPADHVVQSGFYAGLTLGGMNATHEYANWAEDYYDSTCSEYIHRNHGLQHSLAVGAGIGYGWVMDRYYAGVELGSQLMPYDARLDATDYTNERYKKNETTDNNSFLTGHVRSEMHFNVDLTVKPGVFINEETLFYGVLGISYARVNARLRYQETNDDKVLPTRTGSATEDENLWGVVAGVGLKYYVTPRVGVYAETDSYTYAKKEIKCFPGTANVDLRIHGVTGKVGVVVNFF